jgi:hypothetical protein
MAEGQAWVSTVGAMKVVVKEARATFTDTETDAQALRRALLDWYRNRQTDSKRGALIRIEKSVEEILEIVSELKTKSER